MMNNIMEMIKKYNLDSINNSDDIIYSDDMNTLDWMFNHVKPIFDLWDTDQQFLFIKKLLNEWM